MRGEALAMKTLVIGLDGATFSLLQPLMDSGRTPFLASLAARGAIGSLRSTLPPVTAPAWSSFFTGKNPGKHGLLGWQRPLGDGAFPRREWVSSHDIRGDKIWQILGRLGYKVGIMNAPMTYPPEFVNGFMVTGMLTPGPESLFTYPATLKEELFQMVPGYIIDVDIMHTERGLTTATEEEFNKFVELVLSAAHLRTTAAIKLVERYRPDFFLIVYTLLDRLQHSSYRYMLEATNNLEVLHSRAQSSIRALFALDRELERLIGSIADRNTMIFVISDHGFCHHRYTVYLNGWLADKGLLNYRGKSASARQTLRAMILKGERLIPNGWLRVGRRMLSSDRLIDWPSTKAYCGHTTENGIYINVKGRDPLGIVEQEEYEMLRRYLKDELPELVDPLTQQPIFKGAYLREEVYQGPFVHFAPDVIFDLQEGYKVVPVPSSSLQVEDVSSAGGGIHDMEGIFMASGPVIQPAVRVKNANIVDVVPTILHAMNLPVPTSLDGKVIRDILREEYQDRDVLYVKDEIEERVSNANTEYYYSDEDSAEIEERLRNLGYLD
jgi:predicted AlkP superfamily phosphohydrolase/phosphomutase